MDAAEITGPLQPLALMALRRHGEGLRWRLEQPLAGLTTLTPVRGWLQARHLGTVLEVEAAADTIVTLCCDRCLQHYNHPLRVRQRELLEIDGPGGAAAEPLERLEAEARAADAAATAAAEPEGAGLGPAERLDPRGSFDPERWLFEQLSLQLPLVNRCGRACPGPACWGDDPTAGDPRWAALAQLRPATGHDGGPCC